MFHWLPWEDGLCAFNDCRDGHFVTVVLNWKTGQERIIPYPISAVDKNGEWAVSINYARLRLCRPDYGYAGPGQEAREDEVWPNDDGLRLVNLKTGDSKLILTVAQAKDLMPEITKEDGLAYFCHTIISPNAKRIFFLARTVENFRKQLETRGIIYNWDTVSLTVDTDGSNLRRCFPDGWKGSHFNWFDDEILAVTACWDGGDYWAHTIFKVGEEEKVRHIAPGIMDWDGHLTSLRTVNSSPQTVIGTRIGSGVGCSSGLRMRRLCHSAGFTFPRNTPSSIHDVIFIPDGVPTELNWVSTQFMRDPAKSICGT